VSNVQKSVKLPDSDEFTFLASVLDPTPSFATRSACAVIAGYASCEVGYGSLCELLELAFDKYVEIRRSELALAPAKREGVAFIHRLAPILANDAEVTRAALSAFHRNW